jgi:plastocyanin
MNRRSSSGAAGPLWLIAGIAIAAMAGWFITMTVVMFSWGGWDWGWGSPMGRMHGGSDTSNSAVVTGGMSETVDIRNYAFAPGNLQIPAGATVTWTNFDSAPHNATDRGGAWKTQNLDDGESASLTFDQPGTYDYYCTVHPSMKARLTVR